ncbi:magnesium transporter NIPA [Chloropicon primus]|uniref:Probable magnesium transporter n=1 Tax=Chloropicon primus TaxID=1764295 RepID=A0A5B8N239_9CHLO|nr:magnesium transporter NIPA [Chloropicon primus]UPR05121.1 magnesium transporter NIPA [Chloropicon primus]|eukprot:QDZ25920.1 magnesium transporter NIPA [Chloropicon primus]
MLLGICMCTMANVGINLGTNIIKLAFNRRQNMVEQEEEALREVDGGGMNGHKNSRSTFVLNPISEVPGHVAKAGETGKGGKVAKKRTSIAPIYKWRSWQIGFIIFKASNVVNFISLGFGKQSVLASLSSVQFVSNLIFCYFVLHERLGLNDVLGTISIITGVVICIVANSSGSGNKTYTVDELIDLMQDRSYLTYLGVLVVLGVLAYMTYTGDFYAFKLDTEENMRKEKEKGNDRKQSRKGSNLETYYSGTDMSPIKNRDKGDLVFTRIGNIRVETLRPLCFAAYSAVIGTQVVTFAKITMLQIRLSIDGEQQFDRVLTYVFIIGMIVTGIFWDKQINVGLREFDALVIVPVMQSFWTIFAICNGGMFFQEFNGLSNQQIGIFCSGMVVMLFGMGLLMWHEDDVYMEDLEVCGVTEDERIDEDDSMRIGLTSESEKRLMRRTSSVGRASIILYAGSLSDAGMETTPSPAVTQQKKSLTTDVANPLAAMEEGDASLPDELPTRPKRSQTVDPSRSSESRTRKRVSILNKRPAGGRSSAFNFSGGGRRSKDGKTAVGKVRTLSVAATSGLASMSLFGLGKMNEIDEEE